MKIDGVLLCVRAAIRALTSPSLSRRTVTALLPRPPAVLPPIPDSVPLFFLSRIYRLLSCPRIPPLCPSRTPALPCSAETIEIAAAPASLLYRLAPDAGRERARICVIQTSNIAGEPAWRFFPPKACPDYLDNYFGKFSLG